GHQGSLIHHVGQVSAGESRRAAGQHSKIHVVIERNLASVHAQDLLAATDIGTRDHHAAVKAAGTQQRRIEHVRTVGGCDQDDAIVGLEAVHLDQQLVQGLLALVVSAAQARATMAAYGVNFVDENDAGGVLLALFEEVADAACADADEHLYEIGARDAEEGHVGFAGHRARQQGLAGSRRPNQQYALGNASAELLELLRLAQELDNFFQLFLGFIHAGDVFEGHLLLLHGEQSRLALAKRKCLIAATLHLADHDEPQRAQQHEWRQVEQPGGPASRCRVLHRDVDLLVLKDLVHVRIVPRNRDMEPSLVVLEFATNLLAGHRHLGDVALIHLGEELGEVNFALLGARAAGLDDLPQQDARQHDYQPEHDGLDGRIH